MFNRLSAIVVVLMLIIGAVVGANRDHAVAGPEVVGNPSGASQRALIMSGETIKRIVYLDAGAKTPVSGTTPEIGTSRCGNFGDLNVFQVALTGTMSGTNPTLSIKLQNSIDGVNWSDVGSPVVINATTTPSNSKITTSNSKGAAVFNGTTVATILPTLYGDCWRQVVTWGGTSPGASFSILGINK